MRTIDADVLMLHLADYQLQESPNWGANGYGNTDKYEAITDCIDAVESVPTVDAVELRDVAKMLYEMFADSCACNYNDIDEWLPYVCKYEKSGECPSPNDEYGCWMEFLRNKLGVNDGKTNLCGFADR